MSDNDSEIILDLARELFPNLTKGLEQVLIEFGTQLLLRTRNIPVAWWNPKTDEVGLGVVDWEDTGCIPLSIARQISRTDQLTPNAQVQGAAALSPRPVD